MSTTILIHETDGTITCYEGSHSPDDLHDLASEYLESIGIDSDDPLRDAFVVAEENLRLERFPRATEPDETFAEFAVLEESTLIELFPYE